nr:MAG TPA: hypothetical protein [Herelleviridae sp.]
MFVRRHIEDSFKCLKLAKTLIRAELGLFLYKKLLPIIYRYRK